MNLVDDKNWFLLSTRLNNEPCEALALLCMTMPHEIA